MAKIIKSKKTKTYTGKPKSIGPKFCAILLILILAIFSLGSNLIILKTIKSEMKISFNYEARTAVEVLASNINTIHSQSGPTDSNRALALQLVQQSTWNDGRRHFWATDTDHTQTLAGKKEFDEFAYIAEQATDFDFTVLAGYDQAYFDAYAYPQTERYLRISTTTTLLIALFALGACVIAFHRSSHHY